MVLKKERGRFSLRFNGNDPVQRTAIELLEQQPPYSKSQYIANALVYYNTHYADDPKPLKVPVVDRTAIEAIVLEIMQQWAQNRLPIGGCSEVTPVTTSDVQNVQKLQLEEETSALGDTLENQNVDEVTRSLIENAMAAFRSR